MTSWRDLFSAGKFSQCSQKLNDELDSENNTCNGSTEDPKSRICSLYFQHNKIICDALSHTWLPGESQQSNGTWGTTFCHLNNFCKILRCEQLASNIPNELLLVTALNLLWWSWESSEPSDGVSHNINRWIVYSLQSELSRCHENVIDVDNVLDLAEACNSCLLRIPSKTCNIILDILILYMLLLLRHERREDELNRCLKMLEKFLKLLPQIQIHLSSGRLLAERSEPELFFLGPNVAESDCDGDLTVSLIVVTNVLFTLAIRNYEKAWQVLQNCSSRVSAVLQPFIEYLKAFVCLKQNDLDRALYHVDQVSAASSEPLMVKRKNFLCGLIYFHKNEFSTALQHFRGESNLSSEEVQLPITVFFMARAYEALKRREEQIALLQCLADVLRRDPGYFMTRSSPSASLQTRLLGCLHYQPELTLLQTLLASAEAMIKSSRVEDASHVLLEALKIMKLGPETGPDPNCIAKAPSLEQVMRNAVTSLLKCGDRSTARILCKALIDPRLEENSSHFNRAIARMLLIDADKDLSGQLKNNLWLESVRLLLEQKAVGSKEKILTPSSDLVGIALARAYFCKAKLSAFLGFSKDADIYFQRAVASTEGDAAVVRDYKSHLRKKYESDSAEPFPVPRNENIYSELNNTLGYLLHLKRQHD